MAVIVYVISLFQTFSERCNVFIVKYKTLSLVKTYLTEELAHTPLLIPAITVW